VGVEWLLVVPSPSWPRPPHPQAQTLPSDLRASAWAVLAVIAVTPLRPLAWTGVRRGEVVVPPPSWPRSFLPIPQTVPSLWRTSVNSPPASIVGVPTLTDICLGVLRLVVVPSPSWP
jgi:hypothetical protein